jgi:tRNA threonylcarbamoyladenosine biosynthesis protein TsaB
MEPRILIIETSGQPGVVALAAGKQLLGEQRLNEARRHARDLAPMLSALLANQSWRARDLEGVFVSRGPGSYTGLRVGVMSAKTLAYATGAPLLALDTFAAIAKQAPGEANQVDVVADAQQDKLYVQRFRRQSADAAWEATAALAIAPFADWLATLTPEVAVMGPGLAGHEKRLPKEVIVAPREDWQPRAASLLALGMERFRRGDRDDPFAVEPLYLRPSSAEEKWMQR